MSTRLPAMLGENSKCLLTVLLTSPPLLAVLPPPPRPDCLLHSSGLPIRADSTPNRSRRHSGLLPSGTVPHAKATRAQIAVDVAKEALLPVLLTSPPLLAVLPPPPRPDCLLHSSGLPIRADSTPNRSRRHSGLLPSGTVPHAKATRAQIAVDVAKEAQLVLTQGANPFPRSTRLARSDSAASHKPRRVLMVHNIALSLSCPCMLCPVHHIAQFRCRALFGTCSCWRFVKRRHQAGHILLSCTTCPRRLAEYAVASDRQNRECLHVDTST